MSVFNEVRAGTYLDSVALMRMSRSLVALDGVEDAAMMMGTPANKGILRDAGLLTDGGQQAAPGDLIIAVRGSVDAAVAIAEAEALLAAPAVTRTARTGFVPKSLRAAARAAPTANLALISVAGEFATAEARKALQCGLNVMLFSDNIGVDDERDLKRDAHARGLIVMGPDCGTAIIGGAPLAFANVVRRGDIGIIAASGTGAQEVSCLIDRHGKGVSHLIGVGGRDLDARVGGISTLDALAMLEADDATRSIIIVSKPPAPEVMTRLGAALAKASKPVIVACVGGGRFDLPPRVRLAETLEEAAARAAGAARNSEDGAGGHTGADGAGLRGFFCGGTLCGEAGALLRAAGAVAAAGAMVDYGADEFTRGRPHPMIDPQLRDEAISSALDDAAVKVVLFDIVLGHGAHLDPAGALLAALGDAGRGNKPLVASVVGTDTDPQVRSRQVAALEAAGIEVCPSNAAAVRRALALA